MNDIANTPKSGDIYDRKCLRQAAERVIKA